MPWLDPIGWFVSALLIVSVMRAVDPYYVRAFGFRRDPGTGAWSLEV